jgi:hypothetical protein
MAVDSPRLKSLRVVKLRSLLKQHLQLDDIAATPSPNGAVALADGVAFALLESDCELGLGAALAYAVKQDADSLHVLTVEHAGLLARQAAYFDYDVMVSELTGTELVEVQPAAFMPAAPVDESMQDFASVIAASGAEVIVEHGVMRGEVMGLEVARVLHDDAGGRLEVGVGRNDREAFSLLYQHMSADEALAKVVATVSQHRAPGAENHALNLMAVERWLRAILIADPSLARAAELSALPPVLPRPFVDSAGPAAAVGRDIDGAAVVVVCSVGIDLSLAPVAADLRAHNGGDAALQIVLPRRDVYPMTTRLLDLMSDDYLISPIGDDWRDQGLGSAAVR